MRLVLAVDLQQLAGLRHVQIVAAPAQTLRSVQFALVQVLHVVEQRVAGQRPGARHRRIVAAVDGLRAISCGFGFGTLQSNSCVPRMHATCRAEPASSGSTRLGVRSLDRSVRNAKFAHPIAPTRRHVSGLVRANTSAPCHHRPAVETSTQVNMMTCVCARVRRRIADTKLLVCVCDLVIVVVFFVVTSMVGFPVIC